MQAAVYMMIFGAIFAAWYVTCWQNWLEMWYMKIK